MLWTHIRVAKHPSCLLKNMDFDLLGDFFSTILFFYLKIPICQIQESFLETG